MQRILKAQQLQTLAQQSWKKTWADRIIAQATLEKSINQSLLTQESSQTTKK